MNIKTLQREAKRQGLKITQERDEEFKETIYILTDLKTGKEIQSNSKKYLASYLAGQLAL